MIGQHIGGYRVVRQLGEGGMGVVYEAVHEQIGRRAAIKVLRAEVSRDPQITTRFLNEARAANLVQHSGIVDIYEFGQTPEGVAFIVMQYLDGESLRARLQRQGRMGADALRLGRQLASVLAAAHDKQIVHRDLKPENVMIVAEPETAGGERVKLLDFGVAKVAAGLRGSGAEQQTRTGMLIGTLAYMAPEQCRGLSSVDDRADVYALGIMLYELIVGVTPFQGDMGELSAAHLYQPPPPLTGLAAPELGALVARMLAKAPEARPRMRQVVAELESLGAPQASAAQATLFIGSSAGAAPQRSTLSSSSGQVTPLGAGRRPWVGALAVCGVLGLGLGGVVLWQRREPPAVMPPPPPDSTVPLAVAPPPPARVRWVVRSDPPGAQVVQQDNDARLGETPWSDEHAARLGAVHAFVRKDGYLDKELTLEWGKAADLDVKLVAIDPPARVAEKPIVPRKHPPKPIDTGVKEPPQAEPVAPVAPEEPAVPVRRPKVWKD